MSAKDCHRSPKGWGWSIFGNRGAQTGPWLLIPAGSPGSIQIFKDKSSMKNNSGVSQSPPKHLRAETAAWFKHLVGEYDVESHHIRLLTKACEAFDRSKQAREAIEKFGITYLARFNAPRLGRECEIERDSGLAFPRLFRELGTDVAQPADTRPPALRANR